MNVSNRPSEHAVDILKNLDSLPEQAKFAELGIQVSRRIRKEGMLKTFDLFNNKFGGSKDNIQLAKISVEEMTPGGGTRLYTINYSTDRDRVDFVGIAVRMTVDGLLDYAICTYSYKEPSSYEAIRTPVCNATTTTKENRLFGLFNIGTTLTTTESFQIDVRPVSNAIKDEALPYLEAAFLFELKRRGLMVMNGQNNQLELKI